MDSTPRRWVLKPLSPLLQPSDLRTIADPPQIIAPDLDDPDGVSVTQSEKSDGPQDMVVQAWQVAVSQEEIITSDKGHPSSPSNPSSPSSSTGSYCGFYSFVEDPASPEAERNEAWMVSPQRQTMLATLKEEKSFKLQTYSSKRKPESLFPETNEDSQYAVDAVTGLKMVGEEDEKEIRKDIIRNQAPKRSPKVKYQVQDSLDLNGSTNKLLEGFSVSYSSVNSRPGHTHPAEPGTIDNEQINFSAARKQFLKMEQDQVSALLSPPKSTTFPLQPDSNISFSKQLLSYDSKIDKNTSLSDKDDTSGGKIEAFRAVESQSRLSSVFDNLDSGLEEQSVDVAGYTSDDYVFSNNDLRENPTTMSNYETPIEREIRLVQEREENLRHSRGLKHSDSRVEMVEIKTKRIQAPLVRSKENTRVSFVIQQEIQKQNQRRQEHLQQGSNLGEFKGPSKELEYIRNESDQLKTRSQSDSEGVGILPLACSPCPPSKDMELAQNTGPLCLTTGEVEEASSVLTLQSETTSQIWKENLEFNELQPKGQGAQDFIAKEIKEYLRREQELKESRESREGTNCQCFSPPPLVDQASEMAMRQFYPPVKTGKPVSDTSSRPRVRLSSVSLITAQPWTCTHPPPTPSSFSPVKSLAHGPLMSPYPAVVQSAPSPSRGLTETLLQDFEERRSKLKLEDSSYAGIQPIDDVNNEVVESTRVVRHKNQRALRWEAGMFANQKDQ